jgi:hypothetical protein
MHIPLLRSLSAKSLVSLFSSFVCVSGLWAQAAPNSLFTDPDSEPRQVDAYWPLTDAGGATALDLSGANHPGTLIGFTSTAPDHGILSGTSGWSSEGRLDFDGGSDEVQTAFPLAGLVDSSFTLEAVVTHNDAGQTWSPIFGASTTTASADQIFYFGKQAGNGALNVNLGGLANFSASVPGSLTDGRPHHVAVVYDKNKQTLTLYFDYQEIYSQTGITGRLTTLSNLVIGGDGYAPAEHWNGFISDARISREALSPAGFLHPRLNPKRLIVDTDMSGDCDDCGAMAIAHQFADDGEAKILGVMVNDGDPYTPACLDAINTYYGRPGIPIGVGKNLPMATTSPYAEAVAKSFPNRVINHPNLPDAVELYRKLLSEQPDHTVVIASIGFLSNLKNLLNSGPDKYSSLSGVELVRRKVSYAAVMGGVYPASSTPQYNFAEWNFTNDPYATLEFINNFPRPIMFTGFEIGAQIFTGSGLSNPQKNPVCMAYQLYVGAGNNRNSWDPTCVFCAIRGLAGVWKPATNGSVQITDAKADDRWVSTPIKNQVYLVQYSDPSIVASTLEQLITAPPHSMSSDFGMPQGKLDR